MTEHGVLHSARMTPAPVTPRQFRALFHSLVATALSGCGGEVVLPACTNSETFVIDRELGALTATQPLDYLELRRTDFVWNGGGPGTSTPWRVVASVGTRCARATDRAACAASVEGVATMPAYRLERMYPSTGSLLFVYTRGDEVGAVRSPEEFARVFGPIDTPGEAAFLGSLRERVRVTCVRSVQRTGDGWDVSGGSAFNCRDEPAYLHLTHVTTVGVVTSSETTTGATGVNCPVPGRRPEGLVACGDLDGDPVRAWLARAAHMEAAAVHAFDTLASELAAFGAPDERVAAARASREDEVRHAAVMRAWCGREGADVSPVQVAPARVRSREEFALENAVEGCVHETWAAMEALLQSRALRDPERAAEMATIAEDEIRHAVLAWQVAAWIEPQLDDGARARVGAARTQARARLGAQLGHGPDAALVETLGIPTARVAEKVWTDLVRALPING